MARKRVDSAFGLWVKATRDGLTYVERLLRERVHRVATAGPDDDVECSLDQAVQAYLRVYDRIDRAWGTDLRAREVMMQVRDRAYGEMTPEEVETQFRDHASRRGLVSREADRVGLRNTLLRQGLDAESTDQLVDEALPPIRERPERTTLQHRSAGSTTGSTRPSRRPGRP